MFAQARARFFDQLREQRAAAVIPTHTAKVRSNDTEYRFRPHSDFWYLTGFGEPESTLVMLPGLEPELPDRCVLYLRDRDVDMEIWHGRRLGVQAAPEALGVDEARDEGQLWNDLPSLLRGYSSIVWRGAEEPDRDRQFNTIVEGLRRGARGRIPAPNRILDPAGLLHELRLIKTAPELNAMRRAAAITAEAHTLAMQAAAPGTGEHEIDALLEYTFRRRGGDGAAYTNIVAGGANACILHYVENNAPLVDGELLLIDAGAEFGHYACDVTRTFPVNGTFTADQRDLYRAVLAAQAGAIEAAEPGVPFQTVHETALGLLVQGMLDLGILEGTLEQALEAGSYRQFYMHGTSHWLGLDVHDCGSYSRPDGESRPLEPGMVLTIEPGLYIPPDADVDPRWRGMGIRIEDDVLITPEGQEVLTAAIPKTVDEVESACAAGNGAMVRP